MRLPSAFIVLPSAFLLGCATPRSHHAEAFFSGKLDESERLIRAAAERDADAVDVLTLDRASVLLARGEPRRAERLLRTVRDRWDYLEQPDAVESTASVATDDRAKAYAGEEFERVLVRCLLAVCNLLDDGGDAYAYTLQAAAKEADLLDGGMTPVPAVPFLAGVVRDDLPLHAGEAKRHWGRFALLTEQRARSVSEGGVQLAAAEADSLADASCSPLALPAGHGRVCVICFVGRGPRKVASRVEVGPSAGLVIEGVPVEADLSVEVPAYIASPNRVDAFEVTAGGRAFPTRPVLDVTDLARRETDRLQDDRVKAAAARAATKTAVLGGAAAVAEAADEEALAVAALVALLASRSAEECDLRHWSHLPDRIEAAFVPLPSGEGVVTVNGAERPVSVRAGRTAYAFAWVTDAGVL